MESSHSFHLKPCNARGKRKLSYPVSLDAPLHAQSARRFSQVSDAVQRKLSHTLGWGHRQREMVVAEVVSQGRSLCGHYVRARLRRSGSAATRKLGLQRARSAVALPPSVRDVLPALVELGTELERLQPKVYTGVVRQTCHVATDKGVAVVLPAIARVLMGAGTNWAKIASLYAVAGGLAVDCVSHGHPEYVHIIVDSMCQALDAGIALWIADNGGWAGLLNYCRPKGVDTQSGIYVALLAALLLAITLTAIGHRWLFGLKGQMM